MEKSPKYHLAPGLGLRQLEALAAEHVVAVEVVHRVLHAADPTELVFALVARHMVAARILFDRFMAFWTGLGICHYPSDVF